jgi:hypothetical protein
MVYVKARMCAVAHQEASKEDAQEEASKDAEEDALAASPARQIVPS